MTLKSVTPERSDIAGAVNALGGAKPKTGKMKTHEIHVRRGHEGGFIAKHHMQDDQGNAHPHSPEYPIASLKDLHEHMDKHLGEESREISAEKNKKPGMEELD